jgi:hypothetical protein
LSQLFSGVVDVVFCRVFEEFLCAKRGFLMVIGGEVVVSCMAGDAAKTWRKNTPRF